MNTHRIDPAPALPSITSTKQTKSIRKHAGKATSDKPKTVEEGNPLVDHVARIPTCAEKDNGREDAGLEESEEQAHSCKALPVVYMTLGDGEAAHADCKDHQGIRDLDIRVRRKTQTCKLLWALTPKRTRA